MSSSSNDPFYPQQPTVSPFDMDPKVQAWRLIQMEATQKTHTELLHKMNQKLSTFPAPCPRPGLCVQLESRLLAIEELEQQRKGAGKLAVALYAILGGSVSAVVIKFLKIG